MKVKDAPAFDSEDAGEVVEEGSKKKKKVRDDEEDKKVKKVRDEEKVSKKSAKSDKPDKASKKEEKKPKSNSPFGQATSVIAQAFELCRKGTSIKDLTAFVKKQGAEPNRVLRIMRSGSIYGKRWKTNEDKGRIKITYP